MFVTRDEIDGDPLLPVRCSLVSMSTMSCAALIANGLISFVDYYYELVAKEVASVALVGPRTMVHVVSHQGFLCFLCFPISFYSW